MSSTDNTYYNIKRLHVVFALASLALLAVTVWMLAADHWRGWKKYQAKFRDLVELTDAPGRPLAIDQIWLPELTIDYNFRKVARFDRCVTCHQGIAKSAPGHPHPYASHPRLDLYAGSLSPHPMAEFGCTICHDGQGSATEFEWASHTPDGPRQRARWRSEYGWFRNPHWDFPMLPKRFDQSRCLKCHHEVTDLDPSRRFPDPPAAKLLAGYNLVRQNGCFGCHEINGFNEAGLSVGPDMRLEPNRPGAPNPGTMRKVGPSLRDVRGRLKEAYLLDRTGDPANFLPESRMPKFYGMHKYLDGQSLADAKRFEPVEIRATVAYLLDASQPVEPLADPPGATEPPSKQRGKRLFQVHGCLACHKHADFPEGQSTQGPDLSNVGSKFDTRSGGRYAVGGMRWLASWLRNPDRHRPRTLMPNPRLEGGRRKAEGGSGGGEVRLPPSAFPLAQDPAADLAAYLMASTGDFRPAELPPAVESDLDELALLYQGKSLPMTPEKKLLDVGRRTIRRRGCYGCHDIAGFEDAPPIGPALSDWGRKQESLLAFEQINRFVKESSRRLRLAAAGTAAPDTRLAAAGTAASDAAPAADPDHEFFVNALLAHRREGFLWQKLHQPRSFDYKTAQNKNYNQWLTMGRFGFTEDEVEAISTFVLGLVADPPAEKYVYRPDPRRKVIAEGRKVLDKYACAECHTLEMERWAFEFDPGGFEAPVTLPDYDFLKPHIRPEVIAASKRTDLRGLAHAEVVGRPEVDASGKLVEDEDDDGNPLYFFNLWEPAAINGQVWRVGGIQVPISKPQITAKRPPLGGTFARLLYPVVLAEATAAASSTAGAKAWGILPPPLAGEGAKVQPQWLHDYLLDPKTIRPAAVLKMPRYNMSSSEAGKLADYFAAVSDVDFPYTSPPPGRTVRSAADDRRRRGRLDGAMKIIIDRKTFCAKCHLIGDYGPGGETRTVLAPRLDQVQGRLRPGYVRRWLANPRAVLPYTAMPVNFPPSGVPLGQELLPGSSLIQLDAVTDLLLEYDQYLKQRISIRELRRAR